jgi:hypothetical protein
MNNKCEACGKPCKGPFHEEQCKKCAGHHIKLHDLMTAYIIKKTRNQCGSKLVKAGNYNLINGETKKPDIWLECKGEYYYLDIGFSNCV